MRKLLTAATACAAFLVLVGCGYNGQPGEGQKVGQIVKVAKEGIVSSTWEAQMIRGGIADGSGGFGVKPFDFTIENSELARKAEQFMNNQTEVLVRYRAEWFCSAFRAESSCFFAISIEPSKK